MQREDLMRVHHRFLRTRRDLTLPNIGETIIVVASGLLAAALNLRNTPVTCVPACLTAQRDSGPD